MEKCPSADKYKAVISEKDKEIKRLQEEALEELAEAENLRGALRHTLKGMSELNCENARLRAGIRQNAEYAHRQADQAWIRQGELSRGESTLNYGDRFWHTVADRLRTDLFMLLPRTDEEAES